MIRVARRALRNQSSFYTEYETKGKIVMKKAGKINKTYLWKILLSIVLTGSCCFVLLLFTGLIPRSAIKESCIESAEYFSEYGMFPCLTEGQLNTKKDNYSDCILVDIMYHISQDELVKSTVKASYYQPETTTINIGFMDSLKEDNKTPLPLILPVHLGKYDT